MVTTPLPIPPQPATSAATRWRHGPVPVLGVTGSIGSGKSTLSALLAAEGLEVFDADRVSHELLEDPEVRAKVAERFGAGVIGPDGEIDRKSLGSIVFADLKARRNLEAILHPELRRCCERRIASMQEEPGAKGLVVDAALLLEAGWDDLCDFIVAVSAPRALREARVTGAGRMDSRQFAAREAAQWTAAQKAATADEVLENTGEAEDMRPAAERLARRLTTGGGATRSRASVTPGRLD